MYQIEDCTLNRWRPSSAETPCRRGGGTASGAIFSPARCKIILKMIDDCRSVRSLPLLQDDDYFYYRGAGVPGSDDDASSNGSCSTRSARERVDHVGALIRPAMPVPTKGVESETMTTPRPSLQSVDASEVRSEVTCDEWSLGSDQLPTLEQLQATVQAQHDGPCVPVGEVIRLKLRVAELESQLQRLPTQDVKKLQEANNSLEQDNEHLRKNVQELEDREKGQVRRYMLEKIATLKKENEWANKRLEVLLAENKTLREQQQQTTRRGARSSSQVSQSFTAGDHSVKDNIHANFMANRRSSAGDNPYPDAYVPFPKASRRHSTGDRPKSLVSSISCGREAHMEVGRAPKRPSLLDVLRSSFNSKSSFTQECNQGGDKLEASDTSRSTKATEPASEEEIFQGESENKQHESWAATDEINAQTELFNWQSRARLQKRLLPGSLDERLAILRNESRGERLYGLEGDVALDVALPRPRFERRHSDVSCTTSHRSLEGPRSPVQRRQSFILGPAIQGLRSSLSKKCFSESEDEFDIKSVLWDGSSDEEKEDDARTVTTTKDGGLPGGMCT